MEHRLHNSIKRIHDKQLEASTIKLKCGAKGMNDNLNAKLGFFPVIF